MVIFAIPLPRVRIRNPEGWGRVKQKFMNRPKRYLITAALPYANGLKHIGHLAGAYLPADIYTRYLRAQGRDVVYVCGSDEHGTAIPIQAMKEGTTPRAIIDKYHGLIKQNFADLGISFDIYHRTSEPIHHETAQEFFTDLNSRGELEVKETEQYYDEEAKTLPGRPLYRRHLPCLRQLTRIRGSVRELRQFAQP